MRSLLSFTDAELAQLTEAARPLPPGQRAEFVRAVARELEGREVGPGVMHRAIAELQREFMTERRGEPHRRRQM